MYIYEHVEVDQQWDDQMDSFVNMNLQSDETLPTKSKNSAKGYHSALYDTGHSWRSYWNREVSFQLEILKRGMVNWEIFKKSIIIRWIT